MNSIYNIDKENILFLNYNTILLQSMGFIELMKTAGLGDNELYLLDQHKILNLVLNTLIKCPAKLLDPIITNEEYLQVINKKFYDISYLSPMTNISTIATILSKQEFTNKVYIASPKYFNGEAVYTACLQSFFDIFDIDKVAKFINDNGITSIFLHDMGMAYNLITKADINIKGMTFIISKLSYNFKRENDTFTSLYPEIFELKENDMFDLAFMDLF